MPSIRHWQRHNMLMHVLMHCTLYSYSRRLVRSHFWCNLGRYKSVLKDKSRPPRLTTCGVRPFPNPAGSHVIWLGARSSYTFWTIELTSGPSSRATFPGERRRNTCRLAIGFISTSA